MSISNEEQILKKIIDILDDNSNDNDDKNKNDYNLVFKNIYIGNIFGAANINFIKNAKIGAMLSLSPKQSPPNDIYDEKKEFLSLDVEDSNEFPIFQHFEKTSQFIVDSHMKGQNVYVYCSDGISRSPTIVIYHLIKVLKIPLLEAIKFLKEKRNNIRPNDGFIKQLIDAEKLLHPSKFNNNNNNNDNENNFNLEFLKQNDMNRYTLNTINTINVDINEIEKKSLKLNFITKKLITAHLKKDDITGIRLQYHKISHIILFNDNFTEEMKIDLKRMDIKWLELNISHHNFVQIIKEKFNKILKYHNNSTNLLITTTLNDNDNDNDNKSPGLSILISIYYLSILIKIPFIKIFEKIRKRVNNIELSNSYIELLLNLYT
jgi:protein-tyrosine phosphatase